jgi:hypothetical protein
VPLTDEWRVMSVSAVRGLGRGARARARHDRQGFRFFVEYQQLMSCQNSVIMDRAAAPPGQPGQNGQTRPRPGVRNA